MPRLTLALAVFAAVAILLIGSGRATAQAQPLSAGVTGDISLETRRTGNGWAAAGCFGGLAVGGWASAVLLAPLAPAEGEGHRGWAQVGLGFAGVAVSGILCAANALWLDALATGEDWSVSGGDQLASGIFFAGLGSLVGWGVASEAGGDGVSQAIGAAGGAVLVGASSALVAQAIQASGEGAGHAPWITWMTGAVFTLASLGFVTGVAVEEFHGDFDEAVDEIVLSSAVFGIGMALFLDGIVSSKPTTGD